MRKQGGFWWPDFDEVGATAILHHAARHFPKILEHVRKRALALQAGGNVGVYPFMLSGYFTSVVTFEPEGENFLAMKANLATVDNVEMHQAALGAMAGSTGIEKHRNNAGAHRTNGAGHIPVVPIDSLDLEELDLIYLDVEGHEPEVLKGAEATLRRFLPVVILEDMGLASDGEGAARRWLVDRGYRQADRILHDYVMVPE